MAAPSETTWGSTVGSYGKIGFYIDVITNNATTYAFKVQIWFWSKYSVSDSSNKLYFNNLASSGSATYSLGAKSISTTSNSGGWSTTNQKKLYTSGTYTYTRGTSAQTRYLYAKLTGVDRVGGTMYVSKTVSIPKLASYTVSYNANGGAGAPGSQTKWYGKALTLSNTKPTRTGYTFQKWNTNSSGTGTNYAAGASYTGNAALTLYAVWTANTWTVKYDANGGTGAPANQTKTYDKTLTLSSTIPTRENYNFLGWATSATSSTVSYKAGGSYTANSAITLYAVWELAYVKPRINNLSINRCSVTETEEIVTSEDGTETTVHNTVITKNETGTCALVKFDWECDQGYDVESVLIEWKLSTEDSYSNEKEVLASGTSDSVEVVVGDSLLDTDHVYDFIVTVTDNNGHNTKTFILPSIIFTIDMLGGGKGVAFGKAAELENVADFEFQAKFGGGILQPVLADETDLDTITLPNVYTGNAASTHGYLNCPITTGTSFVLEVMSAGDEGQLMQRITTCTKANPMIYERFYYSEAWGDWVCISRFGNKVLWTGAKYMTADHTANLSEAISAQPNGIVLVFSRYTASSSTVHDYNFNTFFIPKYQAINHPGCGHEFICACGTAFNTMSLKYLYIYDTSLVGHAGNNASGTASSGIKYDNTQIVLRYVIGV